MLVCMANQTGCDYLGRKQFFEDMIGFLFGRDNPPVPKTQEELTDTSVTKEELKKLCGVYARGLKIYEEGDKIMLKWDFWEEHVLGEVIRLTDGSYFADTMIFNFEGDTLVTEIDDRKVTFERA